MEKQNVIYPYNRLLLGNNLKKKKKIADTLKNTDKSQNPYAE